MALYKKKSNMPKWQRVLLICAIVVTVLAVGLCGYLFVITRIDHNNILQNITVAGVDVSGMSKAEAIDAVRNATADTYSVKSMVFRIGENEHEITAALSGANLDVESAVDAAYDYGRSGFLFRRYREQKNVQTQTVPIDVTAFLNLDTDAISDQIDALTAKYNCPVVQTEYYLEGIMPADPSDGTGSRVLVIQLGEPGYVLDSNTLYQQIMDAYNTNVFSFTAQCQVIKPDQLDLDAIFQKNCYAPVDATLNKTTFQITDHVNGYGFKPSDVKSTISNSEPGQRLTIPFQILEPEVTREDIEAELFKDLLSEYTAKSGSSSNRDTNLALSCAAVNGMILLPGETFDYNPTLGERTPEAGYKPGATYMGSETVMTYGGGICQTSSTLYYCALTADLEIVTRVNHGFISSYMPYGMDATVSWGGPEFRFRNNTKYPIKIEAYAEKGNVTVKLWGTDDKDYYVKMEYDVLAVYNWKTVEKELPPDNDKGYKDGQVITSPYTGYKIQTYRCKYNKSTDELISKEPETLSVYNSRDKVVCKIVDDTPPATEPTPPTTDATTP